MKLKSKELYSKVIRCAMEVHYNLGPGLLESTYKRCLAYELEAGKIPFILKHPVPIEYKDLKLKCGYRIDMFVDNSLIVELKHAEQSLNSHAERILTYMRLADIKSGLLLDFNADRMKEGIRRFVL